MQPSHSRLARIASDIEGLRLLVLHGSRSRDDAHQGSDWDFAYCADPGADALELHASLTRALETDEIDLVDLNHAGGLLRYRVARDGKVIYQRTPDEFDNFRYEAILFWLDAGAIIESEYDEILRRLG
jgi:predicted nucleotidyltransferase